MLGHLRSSCGFIFYWAFELCSPGLLSSCDLGTATLGMPFASGLHESPVCLTWTFPILAIVPLLSRRDPLTASSEKLPWELNIWILPHRKSLFIQLLNGWYNQVYTLLDGKSHSFIVFKSLAIVFCLSFVIKIAFTILILGLLYVTWLYFCSLEDNFLSSFCLNFSIIWLDRSFLYPLLWV